MCGFKNVINFKNSMEYFDILMYYLKNNWKLQYYFENENYFSGEYTVISEPV